MEEEPERYRDFYGVWHREKPRFFTDRYGNRFREEKDAEDFIRWQEEEAELDKRREDNRRREDGK